MIRPVDPDAIERLRHWHTDEELNRLAAEWRQAESDYTSDAARRDIQEWWRRDRLKEARTARLNAIEFEKAAELGSLVA